MCKQVQVDIIFEKLKYKLQYGNVIIKKNHTYFSSLEQFAKHEEKKTQIPYVSLKMA